jgi:hypothetical protein
MRTSGDSFPSAAIVTSLAGASAVAAMASDWLPFH